MDSWQNDQELFSLIRDELFTAVIGDVLDAAGYTTQFLPPQIKPLQDDMVIVGRALPVLEADCLGDTVGHLGSQQPFGLMLRALDDLKTDEVYICTGASPTYALWGELMSTRAMHLRAAGAVLDGYSRDTHGILRVKFPTFSWGKYAQDQRLRGRVIDFRCSIQFSNGVRVHPGDLIFGDIDGVLVVPHQYESEAVHAALEKVRGENKVRAAIEQGLSTTEAFEKYGIM